MIKEIRKERANFITKQGIEPGSVALTYYDALDLLVESSKLFKGKNKEIEKLLLDGDRVAITKFLQNTTVFNMTIIIVDIIGDRKVLCQTQ